MSRTVASAGTFPGSSSFAAILTNAATAVWIFASSESTASERRAVGSAPDTNRRANTPVGHASPTARKHRNAASVVSDRSAPSREGASSRRYARATPPIV